MGRFFKNFKNQNNNQKSRKIIRKVGFFLLGLIAFILFTSVALAIYVNQNKAEIISKINQQLSENIDGKLEIKDVKFKFLTGFPNATLALKQVVLKDSLWQSHKQTFLEAEEIQIRLNVWKLIDNQIEIRKIVVNNAKINLFKDSNGYTNTYLIKSKKATTSNKTKIKEIVLNQVVFVSKNLKDKKLFQFEIQSLKSKLNYTNNHITTDLKLKMKVKNMIFKPKNGSFLKDKTVEGNLAIDFIPSQNLMKINCQKLNLGKNPVEMKAFVSLGTFNSNFTLDLKTTINWMEMNTIVTPNISKRLNHFDFKADVSGSCSISGKWNVKGNPNIIIKANVNNNELKSPNGTIKNCFLDVEYNNNYIKGKGNNDPNSVITFKNFKGNFENIPFEIPSAKILDLKKPIASGKFKSQFNIEKLNAFIDKKLIAFTSGQTQINFDFNINIVDLKINKPTFTGQFLVKNAHLEYVPKNLILKNTAIELDFTDKSLLIKKIKFIDRENTVFMDGKVDDFLRLYYQDNNKMTVNWNIYSPNLNLQQFVGLLTNKPKFIKKNNTPFSEKIQKIFDKSQYNIHLKVDKMNYGDVVAEHLNTNITTNNYGLKVTNGSLNTLGGRMFFDGELIPKNNYFEFISQTQMQNLDIEKVLAGINNFGMKSLKTQKFKGKLSANTTISGLLLPKGTIKRSSLTLNIKKGTINTMGGTIDFDGELFPKNNLYSFDFNTQINQINMIDFLAAFDNFGMKSLNTTYLKGAIVASANVNGQLLPNWRLYDNNIHLNLNKGTLKALDGDIDFETKLSPKNHAYDFVTTAQINNIDLEQFIATFDYFGIKKLERQKIKGRFTSDIILNGTLLSSGNLLDNSLAVELQNGLVKSMGGTIAFDGKLFSKSNQYNFNANAKINQVAIDQFLETFDNFGITSFQPKNIHGQLNSTTSINGLMDSKGKFISNSIFGEASINITDGSLEDFEPVKNVWRYIFPFRNFKNITFSSITGDFKINGDDVNVSNFKVNSNVLNFDMEGVYSYNKGTNLALTVPLRNPKNDEKINDEILKNEKRDNGIILHLQAVDGDNGKIKIKWNKGHKKEKK